MTLKTEKTPEEWREQLSDLAYHVTREAGTERPWSHEGFPKEPGTYRCVCCDAALFDQTAKFESHCGWPSFDRTLENEEVGYRQDSTHGMTRTEVLCTSCGAHLGHVFPDGPPPTGLRYCINGVALRFEPESEG